MALSGLDIYKLLPKTNCRKCGFATCLAFAMQLAKKAVTLDKCPSLSEEVKKILEESSQPPVRLVSIGTGEEKLDIGNETVLFRHEEKFHHPCGIGFIIEDNLKEQEIKQRIEKIKNLNFERIGQVLKVDLVALKQTGKKEAFLECLKLASSLINLPLVLISTDALALKEAACQVKDRKPLLFGANKENFKEVSEVAREFDLPLVVSAADLDGVSNLTQELSKQGLNNLIIDTQHKPIKEKLWDLTQARRLSLKKSNRSLGYPFICVIENDSLYEEAIEASTYVCKYSGIILLKNIESWQALALLTLRQNIYTDPQKPLQIEPKVYSIGQVTNKSPVLVTTNFSLTYYTVLGEVEASKVPSYIVSIDTEGMSVLTAWAAEKFTPEKIADSLKKSNIQESIGHKRMIIPGYVAVISGDLEEHSGWEVIVGPKEAAALPGFLKNYRSQ